MKAETKETSEKPAAGVEKSETSGETVTAIGDHENPAEKEDHVIVLIEDEPVPVADKPEHTSDDPGDAKKATQDKGKYGNIKKYIDLIKTDEFIASEILHQNALDKAVSGPAQEIELPSSGGLCYIGPGIRFTIDGTTYEMTESNRPSLVSALSAGKEVKWIFSRTYAEKYATGSADITIRVIDHSGELIPDIKRTVSVGI